MNHSSSRYPRLRTAFTLIELLVSTALIALLMVLLLGTVNQTQGIMKRTTAKVAQFQASRAAFEAMTRRLSQATLNTYYTAYDANTENRIAEFKYQRISELQFISGRASKIFTTSPAITNLNPKPDFAYPTHAVFFQAPIGYSETTDSAATTGSTPPLLTNRGLGSLLSTCGYFIEFGDDPQRPRFLDTSGLPPRYRSRLMQLTVPSEKLMIFQRKLEASDPNKLNDRTPQVLDESSKDYEALVTTILGPTANWARPLWMKEGLKRDGSGQGTVPKFNYAGPLADNIVALVILPKKAVKDRIRPNRLNELAPAFEYDSWRILARDTTRGAANAARDNLLPPIVQVVMVAIDEPSALRANYTPANPPKWTSGLFQDPVVTSTEDRFLAEVQRLEDNLKDDPNRINYRVFSTDVVIRGSKWSQPSN
jgi:uncharacterized protein (TIGR02599 family)